MARLRRRDDNSDHMSRLQDARLLELEASINALYSQAAAEVQAEFARFTEAFEEEDKRQNARMTEGEITPEQYAQWRQNNILRSDKYQATVDSLTTMLVNTDIAAMEITRGQLPIATAESYNFVQALGSAAAEEAGLSMGTFQVYNADSIQAIMRDNRELLPHVDVPEDERWNHTRINREIATGILTGDSIPKVAERLLLVTNMDNNAAVRNARTAMTGAENLGRRESADRLREQGIPIKEVWSATYDNRTRETHLMLDGTEANEQGLFGVGILTTPLRYPGDPLGDPAEVYNCRCRLNVQLAGIDHSQDGDLYEQFMRDNYPDDYAELQDRREERQEAAERRAELLTENIQEPSNEHVITAVHVTGDANIASILNEGFDLSRAGEGAGNTWGDGAYFSTERTEQTFYAYRNDGRNGVEAEIDTSNMLTIDFGNSAVKSPDAMYREAARQLPEELRSEYNAELRELKRDGESDNPQRDALEAVVSQHYSGLIITQHNPNGLDILTGGNQIVVYDTSVINITGTRNIETNEFTAIEPPPKTIEEAQREQETPEVPEEQAQEPEQPAIEYRGHIDDGIRYVDEDGFLTRAGATAMSEDLGIDRRTAEAYAESVNEYSSSSFLEIRAASIGDLDRVQELQAGFGDRPNVERVVQQAENIQAFIDASPKWDGGQLSRGIWVRSEEELAAMVQSAQDGQAIDMRGISSWTSDESIAAKFARTYSVDMPEGIAREPGRSVVLITNEGSTDLGTSIRHLSGMRSEQEVLVGSQAGFIPTAVEERREAIYIYGDIRRIER